MKRTIVLFLGLVALTAPAAGAGDSQHLSPVQRIILRENRGHHVSIKPAAVASPVQRIIAQEDARKNDPGLTGTASVPATVEIVQSSGFHWGDAGIGAAVVVAAMLVLAGTTLFLRAARPRRA